MKKLIAAAVLAVSAVSFAATPDRPQLGGWDDERSEERREGHEKRMRMMLVVGIAEALSLSEAEAIRLADKIKTFDDKRKPLREQMFTSMKLLKAAADGDAASLPKVDQATTALLDLRQQMAAVDKEMFLTVSKDLTPQKRAQLAIFLAKFMREGKGHGMRGGRHHAPAPQQKR
ncbi:MAG: hypothetical protein JNK82_37485 [Myxococcaceae bacterium]|nr:hypothetical protein [Myxococcaceae bacterium]